MRNLGDATSSFVLLEYSGSMTEIKSGFPGVFRRDVSFPCSQVQLLARGAFVGNNMLLCILLRHQSDQEEVGRSKDHVLRFGNKKLEEWHGRHHGSSMWKEGGVCTPGEIVSEQFQKVHGIVVQVSWRDRVFGD